MIFEKLFPRFVLFSYFSPSPLCFASYASFSGLLVVQRRAFVCLFVNMCVLVFVCICGLINHSAILHWNAAQLWRRRRRPTGYANTETISIPWIWRPSTLEGTNLTHEATGCFLHRECLQPYETRYGELGLDCPDGILLNSRLIESHHWFFNWLITVVSHLTLLTLWLRRMLHNLPRILVRRVRAPLHPLPLP